MLRQMRQEFQDKAAKYCQGADRGDESWCGSRKKLNRFDKMKMKEEIGFKLEELPVRKQLRRADLIITRLMKKQVMFMLSRVK